MAGHLAFWMANSSEFLNFLKQDMDLSGMTEESQKILAHTTQQAFRSLVQCIKAELQTSLPAFLDPSEEGDLDEQGGNGVDDKYDPMEGYQSTERSFKVRQYGAHGQPLGGDQWMGKAKKLGSAFEQFIEQSFEDVLSQYLFVWAFCYTFYTLS